MENLLIAIIVILLIIIICLIVKIRLIYRETDDLMHDFQMIIEEESNLKLRVSSSDKHILKLALKLNEELSRLRSISIKYNRGNSELETAVVNISHDLRTPLTAISGYLDLLEQEDMNPDARKYISIIGERIDVLKMLTEELFKYSIVTATIDEFVLEEVCINSELESAIAGLYGAFTERNIVPEINLCDDRVIRKLDRKSIQRVFSNILGNALKYSKGDLSISLNSDGTIIFANEAPELDAVDVGKLFDRFFTVETAHYSTGLGLAIARTLTEKNGGTITADLVGSKLQIVLKF